MFKKNIDALKIHNPKLAEKLEKIDINSVTGIDVYQAESKDLIIAYNNTPLHSPIDPIREAKTIWNRTIKSELNKNDIQMVFGLGLGYLFKRAYINAESKIFVIEPNIQVLRFVAEHVDFSQEFADNRVFITDNLNDLYEKLYKTYLSGDRIEILFLNHFAQVHKDILQDITIKTYEIIESRKNDANTIFNLCPHWTENFIRNSAHFPETRLINQFEEKFSGKTALIISAGPGLKDDIEIIKANQDKFVIIAVGKILGILEQEGIIPDFTVFADAQNCYNYIDETHGILEKTNMIILAKGDFYVCGKKTKSKILYVNQSDKLSKLFENPLIKEQNLYKSGSSVSIIAYYTAKALGFSQIIFSGLDLAFVNNEIYADGQKFETTPEGQLLNINKKIIYVKDKNGNEIPTRDDYAWFIRQFKEIFTEELNLARIINTSTKGAYIEGMEYKTLSEVLKDVSEDKPNVDKIIADTFAETQKDWEVILSDVYSKMNETNKDMQEIYKASNEIIAEFNKICSEYNETGKTTYRPDDYNLLNEKVIYTRQKLINNVFLGTFMQKPIWDYSKNYITKSLPSKEDIIKNFELEISFFNTTKTSCEYLTTVLNQSTESSSSLMYSL